MKQKSSLLLAVLVCLIVLLFVSSVSASAYSQPNTTMTLWLGVDNQINIACKGDYIERQPGTPTDFTMVCRQYK